MSTKQNTASYCNYGVIFWYDFDYENQSENNSTKL